MKNLCAKRRPVENPYEIWMDPRINGPWTWRVLKKYQADDNKPFARWLCHVTTPYVPQGEQGDCYVRDIVGSAVRIQ